MILLTHNRIQLALHELRDGEGTPLLLLHGLGEHSPAHTPNSASAWTGPVYALDFTGHGQSTVPVGGGYTAEVLMADADTAVAHLGPSTIIGRGLGGYIAVLLAGARPALVRGAVIEDGPGSAGCGPAPTSQVLSTPVHTMKSPPDPFALYELSKDIRPPDYAANFARLAVQHSGLDVPLAVAARFRPAWLQAVADEAGVVECSVQAALELFSGALPTRSR